MVPDPTLGGEGDPLRPGDPGTYMIVSAFCSQCSRLSHPEKSCCSLILSQLPKCQVFASRLGRHVLPLWSPFCGDAWTARQPGMGVTFGVLAPSVAARTLSWMFCRVVLPDLHHRHHRCQSRTMSRRCRGNILDGLLSTMRVVDVTYMWPTSRMATS